MTLSLEATEIKVPKPPALGAPVAAVAHRVTPVDLERIGHWLVPKLRERRPDIGERFMWDWLRACMWQNGILFIWAGEGVAMATLEQSFLEPPWVKEVFVLGHDGDGEELDAVGLYSDMYRWAASQGATYIQVNNFSNCLPGVVNEEMRVFGAVVKKVPVSVVRMPEKAV